MGPPQAAALLGELEPLGVGVLEEVPADARAPPRLGTARGRCLLAQAVVPAAVVGGILGLPLMALVLGARQGMFIAGGIAQRYPSMLLSSGFRAAFEAKGRHRSLMEKIPTQLIRYPQPGLLGASYMALQLLNSSA